VPRHADRLTHQHLPIVGRENVRCEIVRLQVDPRTSLEVPRSHLRFTQRAEQHLRDRGHVGWCQKHHHKGSCTYDSQCAFAHVIEPHADHYRRLAEKAIAENIMNFSQGGAFRQREPRESQPQQLRPRPRTLPPSGGGVRREEDNEQQQQQQQQQGSPQQASQQGSPQQNQQPRPAPTRLSPERAVPISSQLRPAPRQTFGARQELHAKLVRTKADVPAPHREQVSAARSH